MLVNEMLDSSFDVWIGFGFLLLKISLFFSHSRFLLDLLIWRIRFSAALVFDFVKFLALRLDFESLVDVKFEI